MLSTLRQSNGNRPSTGLDMSNIVIRDSEDSVCPSPNIRTVYESQHRAHHDMRFTKPAPFQESKNFWKKKESTLHRRQSETAFHSLTKKSHMITCTNARVSMDSTYQGESMSGVMTDSASVLSSEGLCRGSPIPSWPHLRQARHRHSSPALKSTNITSPRRKHSTRGTGSSASYASPRRAILPRRLQSRAMIPFFRHDSVGPELQHGLEEIGQNEILVKTEFEVYNELPLPGEDPATMRAGSSLSIWNDPSEQQSFTATWRNHQDGHTSRDVYLGRLPFESSPDPKKDDGTSRTTSKRAIESSPASKLGSAGVAPRPPERKSSKDKAVQAAKPMQLTRPRSQMDLKGIMEEQTIDQILTLDSNVADYTPSKRSTKRTPMSASSKSKPRTNLKTARSIESLSQIEAMIPSASANEIHTTNRLASPTKKKPAQKRSLSKGTYPSGSPPERPLPELPIDQDDNIRHDRSSVSCMSDNDVVSSSVFGVSTSSNRSPDSKKSPGISKISRSDSTTTSPSVSPRSSSSDREGSSPSRRTKPITRKTPTDRSERIRDLKKKHIAAMAKAKAATTGSSTETDDIPPTGVEPSQSTPVANSVLGVRTSQTEFPHPPPPLPPSAPARHHTSPNNSNGAKTYRRDGVDELDQFPAVPLSRPASRASAAPTVPTGRGISRTSSSPRKPRSRARTVQGRQSSVSHDNRSIGKQTLAFSLIYINVDTDPPKPRFQTSSADRSTSKTRKGRADSCSRERELAPSSAPISLGKRKQSFRSLRSQASIARSMPRHGLERVSPVPSRPGSRPNPGLLSSDQESDHDSFIPKRVSSARPTSKASMRSRASRRRKESGMPELPMTGQFAMEHVLMALAKCQNQGVDISHLNPDDVQKLAHQQKIEDELDSRAAKRLSLAQRPRRPFSGRFDDPRKLLDIKPKLSRPVSDMSMLSAGGTDTDASVTTAPSETFSSLGKRGSGGSLTDPTDCEIYDFKPIFRSMQPVTNTDNSRLIRARRRPSSPTLSSKPFLYPQHQLNFAPSISSKRSSRLHLPPPVAPPRTTSRSQTDLTTIDGEKVDVEIRIDNASDVIDLDLDGAGTSDPIMLGILDGMATWSSPTVDESGWMTWGDAGRVIEGKALVTPPASVISNSCA